MRREQAQYKLTPQVLEMHSSARRQSDIDDAHRAGSYIAEDDV
jgi:hypothetical protein